MDDAALTATLDSAKTEEARAILARDEAQRAVEGLDEASLLPRRDALRKRRERLVNDRLRLGGATAKLEDRAKTRGGAGNAPRAERKSGRAGTGGLGGGDLGGAQNSQKKNNI